MDHRSGGDPHHGGGGGGGGGGGNYQRRRYEEDNNNWGRSSREWSDRRDHREGGRGGGGDHRHGGGGGARLERRDNDESSQGGGGGRFERRDKGGRSDRDDRDRESIKDTLGPPPPRHTRENRGQQQHGGRGGYGGKDSYSSYSVSGRDRSNYPSSQNYPSKGSGRTPPTPAELEKARTPVPVDHRRTLVLAGVPGHVQFFHLQNFFQQIKGAPVQYCNIDRATSDAYVRFKFVGDARRIWEGGTKGLDGPLDVGIDRGGTDDASLVSLGVTLKAIHFTNYMIDNRSGTDRVSGDQGGGGGGSAEVGGGSSFDRKGNWNEDLQPDCRSGDQGSGSRGRMPSFDRKHNWREDRDKGHTLLYPQSHQLDRQSGDQGAGSGGRTSTFNRKHIWSEDSHNKEHTLSYSLSHQPNRRSGDQGAGNGGRTTSFDLKQNWTQDPHDKSNTLSYPQSYHDRRSGDEGVGSGGRTLSFDRKQNWREDSHNKGHTLPYLRTQQPDRRSGDQGSGSGGRTLSFDRKQNWRKDSHETCHAPSHPHSHQRNHRSGDQRGESGRGTPLIDCKRHWREDHHERSHAPSHPLFQRPAKMARNSVDGHNIHSHKNCKSTNAHAVTYNGQHYDNRRYRHSQQHHQTPPAMALGELSTHSTHSSTPSTNPTNNTYHRSPLKGATPQKLSPLGPRPQQRKNEEQQQWEAYQKQESEWRGRRRVEYNAHVEARTTRLSHLSTLEQKRDLLSKQEEMLNQQLPLHKKVLSMLKAKNATASDQSKKMKEILNAQTRIAELRKETKTVVEHIEKLREEEQARGTFRPSEKRPIFLGGIDGAGGISGDGGGNKRSLDRRTTVLKVEGFDEGVTKDAIKEHFSVYGLVTDIGLDQVSSNDNETSSSSLVALVNFANRVDAERAISSNIKFNDTVLSCEWHKFLSLLPSARSNEAHSPGSGEGTAHANPPADVADADADDELYDDVLGGTGGAGDIDEEALPADNEENVDYDYDDEEDMVDYD